MDRQIGDSVSDFSGGKCTSLRHAGQWKNSGAFVAIHDRLHVLAIDTMDGGA
ncbi:MAG: hypothetical protein JNN30_05925 [Rhodanobacteraceae bacterium]|nr:hypothetical protein [Rhodanobacteraceae bacterium]